MSETGFKRRIQIHVVAGTHFTIAQIKGETVAVKWGRRVSDGVGNAVEFETEVKAAERLLEIAMGADRRAPETPPAAADESRWHVPKIAHDEEEPAAPVIRGNWIFRSAGSSTAAHTRHYAAQLLAAADELDRRQAAAEQDHPAERPAPVVDTRPAEA